MGLRKERREAKRSFKRASEKIGRGIDDFITGSKPRRKRRVGKIPEGFKQKKKLI